MLVNFKRDFFGPGGVLYSKGTREFNGDPDKLPSDALVVSETGTLPVQSNSPKPGHGAKPLEEQVLDLIPGASPTHQIEQAGSSAAPALTDEERKTKQEESDKLLIKEREDASRADTEKAKELVKETEAGVKNAEKAADLVEKATDPLAALMNEPTKGKK